MQRICWALIFAEDSAGSSIAARIAIIAITTRSSIKVKPTNGCVEEFDFTGVQKHNLTITDWQLCFRLQRLSDGPIQEPQTTTSGLVELGLPQVGLFWLEDANPEDATRPGIGRALDFYGHLLFAARNLGGQRVGLIKVDSRMTGAKSLGGKLLPIYQDIEVPTAILTPVGQHEVLRLVCKYFEVPRKPALLARITILVIPKITCTGLFSLKIMIPFVLFFAGIDVIDSTGLQSLPFLEFRRVLELFYLPLLRCVPVPIDLVIVAVHLIQRHQSHRLRRFAWNAEQLRRTRKGVGFVAGGLKLGEEIFRFRYHGRKGSLQIHLGAKHNRTIQEGEAIRIILESFRAEMERHFDFDGVFGLPGMVQPDP